MLPSLARRSTLSLHRVTIAGALAALLSLAPAGHAESAAAQSAAAPVIIQSTDADVQADLGALTQFLDGHPQIEEALRANLEQAEAEAFRKHNPDWDALLKKRPTTIKALKVERRFLLHRALARIARSPLMKEEVFQLDAFLDQHPEIKCPLEQKPSLIRDGAFLTAHPKLGEFLSQHPAMFTALADHRPSGKGDRKGPSSQATP